MIIFILCMASMFTRNSVAPSRRPLHRLVKYYISIDLAGLFIYSISVYGKSIHFSNKRSELSTPIRYKPVKFAVNLLSANIVV